MFLSDIDVFGYPEGTFKIDQKVFRIIDKIHRFSFHKNVNIVIVQELYQ